MTHFHSDINTAETNRVTSFNGLTYPVSGHADNTFYYLQTGLISSINIQLKDFNSNTKQRVFLQISHDGENWDEIIPVQHLEDSGSYEDNRTSLLSWEGQTQPGYSWPSGSFKKYAANKPFAYLFLGNINPPTIQFSTPVYLMFYSITQYNFGANPITENLILSNAVEVTFSLLNTIEQELVYKYSNQSYYSEPEETKGLITVTEGNIFERKYTNVVSLQVNKIHYEISQVTSQPVTNTHARLYIIETDVSGNPLNDSKFDRTRLTIEKNGQIITSSNNNFNSYISGADKIPTTTQSYSASVNNLDAVSRPYAWINETTEDFIIIFDTTINVELKIVHTPDISGNVNMIIDLIPNLSSNSQQEYTAEIETLLGNPFSTYGGMTAEMTSFEKRLFIIRYLLNELLSETNILTNVPKDSIGLTTDQLNMFDDSITTLSIVKATSDITEIVNSNIQSFYAVFDNVGDKVKDIIDDSKYIIFERLSDDTDGKERYKVTRYDGAGETIDAVYKKPGDIVQWETKKFLIGSLTASEVSQGTSSGDPYITTLSGNCYKLPNKYEIYRLFQSSIHNKDIIVNASVSNLTDEEINNLLNISKKYTNKIPVVNGFFYDKFYISYGEKFAIFDRNIKLEQTNIDQLSNENISILYNNEQKEFYCDIQGKSTYTHVTLKIFNVEIKLLKINHPQIINGIEINYNGDKNNVSGLINSEIHPKNYKVKKLHSRNIIIEKQHKLYKANKKETWISV